MGKVLPNRTCLFLTLTWVSPNSCVILYLLFNCFHVGHFQKKTKKKYINPIKNTMSLQSKTSITNTFFCFYPMLFLLALK